MIWGVILGNQSNIHTIIFIFCEIYPMFFQQILSNSLCIWHIFHILTIASIYTICMLKEIKKLFIWKFLKVSIDIYKTLCNQTYRFLYKFLKNFSNTKYILKKHILDMKMLCLYLFLHLINVSAERLHTPHTHTPLFMRKYVFCKFYILS